MKERLFLVLVIMALLGLSVTPACALDGYVPVYDSQGKVVAMAMPDVDGSVNIAAIPKSEESTVAAAPSNDTSGWTAIDTTMNIWVVLASLGNNAFKTWQCVSFGFRNGFDDVEIDYRTAHDLKVWGKEGDAVRPAAGVEYLPFSRIGIHAGANFKTDEKFDLKLAWAPEGGKGKPDWKHFIFGGKNQNRYFVWKIRMCVFVSISESSGRSTPPALLQSSATTRAMSGRWGMSTGMPGSRSRIMGGSIRKKSK